MEKISVETLHEIAERAIIEHYLDSDQNKLAPEETLAEMLGVSRVTIREAMNSLVRKNYLTKRKGKGKFKGNFIQKSVINTKMRIDQISDFSRQIEDLGYKPGMEITFRDKTNAEGSICEKFGCEKGEPILNFLFHFLADGNSAIRLHLQSPEKLFKSTPANRTLFGEDIYKLNFFKENCNIEISHYISLIEATVNPEINKEFGLSENLPLVVLEQYFHDLFDQCVGYGHIFLNPKYIKLSVVSMYE
jgi:DNA-binding GntR family transcriptional regulator